MTIISLLPQLLSADLSPVLSLLHLEEVLQSASRVSQSAMEQTVSGVRDELLLCADLIGVAVAETQTRTTNNASEIDPSRGCASTTPSSDDGRSVASEQRTIFPSIVRRAGLVSSGSSRAVVSALCAPLIIVWP